MPDREQFLRQSDKLWDALWAKLGALSDEQLARRGASGSQWSGKDVLAHIAHWYDHKLEGIRAIDEGREPISRSDFDEWNARWFAEDSALIPSQARDRCEASHERLRSYLAALTEVQWAESTRTWPGGVIEHTHQWADLNMGDHYREHLNELADAAWPD